VSREDLMMVLQNIDYILIKSSYDQNQDEVRSAFHTLLFALFMVVIHFLKWDGSNTLETVSHISLRRNRHIRLQITSKNAPFHG